jgi:hypothetical protein
LGIKNAKFDADFEYDENLAKIFSPKKIIDLKVIEFFCFSSLNAVGKTFKPYNFFPNFFDGFEVSFKL